MTITEKANIIISKIEEKINNGEKIIKISPFDSTINNVTTYGYSFGNSFNSITEHCKNYMELEMIYNAVINYFNSKKDKNRKYIIHHSIWSKTLYIDYKVLDRIEVITPCKEFIKLNTYLGKYGGKSIDEKKFFNVHTFGKRGVYRDTNKKYFYAEDSELCAKVLEWLRKYRSSKDIVDIFPIIEKDEEDKNYSMYYETECYGSRIETYKIKILTPTGRIKKVTSIFKGYI